MTSATGESGFLLMEALIAVSLVGVGALGCWEAVHNSGRWIRHDEMKMSLAREAEIRWFEYVTGTAPGERWNSNDFYWSVSSQSNVGVTKAFWRAAWKEKGSDYEESFEWFQLAK